MRVAVLKESFPGEQRVALVPAAVPSLTKAGVEIRIQSGAGVLAGYPDEHYAAKGAIVTDNKDDLFAADVLLCVRTAGANTTATVSELPHLRRGQTVIGMADPLGEPKAAQEMAEKGVSLFALEMIPRITRAQSMDVLSAMATVAGYRAVLLGALALPKMFPMMMTAAGTLSPARAFIVGAGVAGLQAISTARRLGAVVSAYDVRAAVKEQVQSLGAKFVEFELESADAEDKGGYAKQMDEEFYRRQREMMARVLSETDLVVTTAAVPGKKAPILVTKEMVAGMPAGSVVVDLAAERGGNCELTQPGQTVKEGGVTILGPTNLPSEVPFHASQMYAKNITTFLLHLLADGQLKLDMDDEITRDTLIARDGKVVHPRVCELLGIETPAPAGETSEEESN